MSTKIEWTEEVWNPTIGCTRVSAGCDNCYAIMTARIRSGHPNPKISVPFAGTVHRNESGRLDWTGQVNLLPDRLGLPFKWRSPKRIFVNSQSDLFHKSVPDGFIAQVWNVMAQNPHHTFQILTKNPARMRSWVTRWADRTGDGDVDGGVLPPMPRGPEAVRATYTSGRARLFADMLDSMGEPPEGAAYPLYDWMDGQRFWPAVLPNVWLGVSVEDQHWADVRIPALLDTPAAVRWLSCEPLLGPVDLRPWLWEGHTIRTDYGTGVEYDEHLRDELDWVVVGGESGAGARPMHPAWALSLRDQCAAAQIPFLFKQWGNWAPIGPDQAAPKDVVLHRDGKYFPLTASLFTGIEVERRREMYVLRNVGKKRAGRELDGRVWDEYPEAVTA